jgi:hypothetical protein
MQTADNVKPCCTYMCTQSPSYICNLWLYTHLKRRLRSYTYAHHVAKHPAQQLLIMVHCLNLRWPCCAACCTALATTLQTLLHLQPGARLRPQKQHCHCCSSSCCAQAIRSIAKIVHSGCTITLKPALLRLAHQHPHKHVQSITAAGCVSLCGKLLWRFGCRRLLG